MEPETKTTRNLSIFIIIWIGQILSIFGSAVAEFGITLWAYETTGKATPLTLIGVFYTIPMLALSPVVGVMVDRYNRKLMMMLSDLSAALVSVIVLVLLVTGNLQIWHLYVTAVIAGVFQGFHWPAYSAAISTMLPKQHYARANAMLEMAGPASGIFAPMVAGALIAHGGRRADRLHRPARTAGTGPGDCQLRDSDTSLRENSAAREKPGWRRIPREYF